MARQPEVVSVGMEDHPALSSRLEQALRTAVQDKINALVSAKDWPDYEKRRGEINGLNLAITLCQDEQKKLGR